MKYTKEELRLKSEAFEFSCNETKSIDLHVKAMVVIIGYIVNYLLAQNKE